MDSMIRHRTGRTYDTLLLWVSIIFVALSFPTAALAQSYSVLYSFQCGPSDGAGPISGVVNDWAGNLYGTTGVGGTNNAGTVYRLAADGTEKVLYSFTGPPADGAGPGSAPIVDPTGNLYGTTETGGRYGYGIAYGLTPLGTETILHNFGWVVSDGRTPNGLIRNSAGQLFGTAFGGGGYHGGTAFELFTSGAEFTLYGFGKRGDGIDPNGPLVQHAGDFYGNTRTGGAHGAGSIFQVSMSGTENLLYSFEGGPGGSHPYGRVVRDAAGNLFGTTADAGTVGYGTVFRLSAAGQHRVLHTFTGQPDGAKPFNGLTRDSAGNLYGVTFFGGSGPCLDEGGDVGCGAIFEVSAAGQESVLYSFNGPPDGQYPTADLIWDSSGNLYGTTEEGGASGCGTVFKFTP